jgi:hypothetical protein
MTFHVRLVSLPHRTNDLVESLAADVGVSNLLVLPGAAREPDGDAVQFDVQPRSANSVFENLQTFQHDHSGTVAVEYLDANLGEEATPASKHFLVQRDIPPVWEVVEARIRPDAIYAPSFYILLAIAGLIGAVGILTNSQILIVGAMVVGPEYNAIMGVALGIDKRARRPRSARPASRILGSYDRHPALRPGDFAGPGIRRSCTRSGCDQSPASSTVRTCSRSLSPFWPG